jgi:hypothetical protein
MFWWGLYIANSLQMNTYTLYGKNKYKTCICIYVYIKLSDGFVENDT